MMYLGRIIIDFETEEDLEAFCEHLDEREDLNYTSYEVEAVEEE